jgi:hypothetical protein
LDLPRKLTGNGYTGRVSAQNPSRREGSELPDADAAMPPGYWLLAREWRTVAEYVAARRAVRDVNGLAS